MSVLLIVATADERNRCSALLDAAGELLQTQLEPRLQYLDKLHIRNLSPQALLLGDKGHPTLVRARQQIAAAQALVVATPVTHGSYSGVLKVLLDQLAPNALRGKLILPMALAERTSDLDLVADALSSVFSAMAAHKILPCVAARVDEVPELTTRTYHVTDSLRTRLDKATTTLVRGLQTPVRPRFTPILIEPTLLSV